MPQSPQSPPLARRLAARLGARRQRLATAESCTGGLIAKTLTDLPGSSVWFERGLVTYSNESKQQLLGVSKKLLDRHGAVSGEVAAAMARGLLRHAPVDWTLTVTGIAGPGGGRPDKPVGTVWIACAGRGSPALARRFRFRGGRSSVRRQSAQAALAMLLARLESDEAAPAPGRIRLSGAVR